MTETALAAFSSAIPPAERAILDEVLVELAELKRTGDTVQASVANLKLANGLRSKLEKIVLDSRYSVALRQFMRSFTSTGNLLREYFASLNVGFEASKALYVAVQESNITTTIAGLLGAGMTANFVDPVTDLLQRTIAGGTSYKDLRELLRRQIVGGGDESGRLAGYAPGWADDAIHQFQRNYMEAISADLNLEYYLYGGTVIRTTRPFCQMKAGKYYSLKEVQGWASRDWAGKIPGTNSQNIRTYLGGYRCRHRLIPVSEEIFNRERE